MQTIGSSKANAPGASGVIIYVCVGAAILGVLSTAAYLLTERSSGTVSATLQTGVPAPNARTDSAFENTSHERHMALAMSAYSADKLVAPAGENALEHYLAALKSKPDDFGAQEAILELVPVAMTALETAMAANSAEEVERLIPLLELADPSASRVIALKKRWQETITQQASVEAARTTAAQEPVQVLPSSTLQAEQTPQGQKRTEAVATKAVTNVAENAAAPAVAASVAPTLSAASEKQSTPSARQSAPATTPAPAQDRVVEARALSTARAVFPTQARRQKIEGWVDLQVAVDASGRVTGAVVLSAQPSRIFDVEARRAVMRWRYSPKRVNDQPVSSVLRQRIKFSLAG